MSKKSGKAMPKKSIQKEKIELVRLRIRNKYYDKDQILENVADEILKDEVKKQKD
jgi:hypothetical protein